MAGTERRGTGVGREGPPPSPSRVRAAAAVFLALLAGVAAPVFLLLGDAELVAYHRSAYRESFAVNPEARATGLSVSQLTWTIERVLDYATGRRADLQFDLAELDGGPAGRPAFSQRELDHMVDVRALFATARTVRWAALVLVVLGAAAVFALETRRAGKRLATGFVAGAALSLLTWGALAFAALRGFGGFWTNFHEVLFTNELWLLPANALLIRMLPESLFERLVLEVIGLLAVEALLGLLLSVLYLRRRPAWR